MYAIPLPTTFLVNVKIKPYVHATEIKQSKSPTPHATGLL